MTLQALGDADDARTRDRRRARRGGAARRRGRAGARASLVAAAARLHRARRARRTPTACAPSSSPRQRASAAWRGRRTGRWRWSAACPGTAARWRGHLAESERLADELGSPVLRCWTAEIAVELHSGTGDWDAGLALAERTIPMARALRPARAAAAAARVGRDDPSPSRQCGAGEGVPRRGVEALGRRPSVVRVADVHSAVPVHAGFVAYHVAMGDSSPRDRDRRRRARAGRSHGVPGVGDPPAAADDDRGGALAGRSRDGAPRYRARLRKDSLQLGHKLGIAWADTCDAPHRDAATGTTRQAVAAAAARAPKRSRRSPGCSTRRACVASWLGARRSSAISTARRASCAARTTHSCGMRAEVELRTTRDVIRELGLRPPREPQPPGVGALTGREVDVARLAACAQVEQGDRGRAGHLAAHGQHAPVEHLPQARGGIARRAGRRGPPTGTARDMSASEVAAANRRRLLSPHRRRTTPRPSPRHATALEIAFGPVSAAASPCGSGTAASTGRPSARRRSRSSCGVPAHCAAHCCRRRSSRSSRRTCATTSTPRETSARRAGSATSPRRASARRARSPLVRALSTASARTTCRVRDAEGDADSPRRVRRLFGMRQHTRRRDAARGAPPLRRRQRLLRALARPADDLLVRLLPDRHARSSTPRRRRSWSTSAGSCACDRASICSTSGAGGAGCSIRGDALRRVGRRDHAQRAAGRAGARAARGGGRRRSRAHRGARLPRSSRATGGSTRR